MTPKQEKFVQEYMVDLNASQAAIRAWYSRRTADRIGHQLLKNLEIQRSLQEARMRMSERTEATVDRVIKALSSIAFAPASDETGSKLRYASKLKALELLGKHLGMFDAKPEQDNVIQVVFDGHEDYAG